MKKQKNLTKLNRLPVFITLICAFCCITAVTVYAFFSTRAVLYTEGGTTYFRMGMELNTFFDIINSDPNKTTVTAGTNLGIVCTDTSLAASGNSQGLTITTNDGKSYYTYNPNATWGSASNPYLISKINHLQNLYVLQNCGYFESLTSSGITENCMPYFLVCGPDGSIVTIDGTNKTFEYIGNDEYPFIGYVGGAFDTTTTTTVNGMESKQSVIYNLTVQTDDDVVDIGLFAHVGYLGNGTNVAEGATFDGSASTISDLLLYDVRVVDREASDGSVWTLITDLADHLYSFLGLDSSLTYPKENHHVGILAGHVEYATIQYISVYYSDSSIAAIDIKRFDIGENEDEGTSAAVNYYSASGIIGYLFCMNSTQEDGKITRGGISNKDVEVNGQGAGSGGGVLSGVGRGYVTAKKITDNYYTLWDNDDTGNRDNISQTDRVGQEVWEYYKKGSSVKNYGAMVDFDGSNYTLHDHPTILATIDSNNLCIINGNEWTTYIVHDTRPSVNTYVAEDGTELSSFKRMDLYIYNALNLQTDERLCTEYIRDRIIYGTENTGMYYFYDGVFTFALSNAWDMVEDTWKNNTPDSLTVGLDDSQKWTTAASGDVNAVVAFAKPVTSQSQLAAGKKLFITYKTTSGGQDTYHLIYLNGNSDYNQGNMNNALTTPAQALTTVSAEDRAELRAALDGGYLTLDPADSTYSGNLIDVEGLKNDWNNITIFDVGAATTSAFTLDDLKQKFQITAAWNSTDSDNKVYEDDGVTEATETLKTNSQNIKNIYYLMNSSMNTNYTATDPISGSTYTYFNLGTNPVQLTSLSGLQSAISTLNSSYFEEDWTTPVTDSNSPLSTKLTLGSPITQTEYTVYQNGFYYFDTIHDRQSATNNNCIFRLYKIDANGNKTSGLTTGRISWNNTSSSTAYSRIKGMFSSTTTDANGIMLGTFNGVQLPVLYELNGDYFTTWTRNIWSDDYIEGGNSATIIDNKLSIPYTQTYNYIVAEMNGNGITYKYLNNTVCTNVQATSNYVASIHNFNFGIYDSNTGKYKNYRIYSCKVNGQTQTGILITKYYLDGYFLKSQTGKGVTTTLNESTTLSGAWTPTGTTWTLNGQSFEFYRCNQKMGVCLARCGMDGFILATMTDSGTTYTVNAANATTEPQLFVDQNGNPLTITLSNGSVTKQYNLYHNMTGTNGALGILLITDGQSGGYYNFYHKDTARNGTGDTYYLRMLRRQYVGINYYSVLSGTDYYVETARHFYGVTLPDEVENTIDARVVFNADGSCSIAYTLNGRTRYLSYDSSNNYFNTSTSQGNSTKLYIFTVEATHDTSVTNRIIPVTGTEVGTYSADNYVLYPNSTLTATANGNGETVSSTISTDPSYRVVSLAELYAEDAGWKNATGEILTEADLYKRFRLREEISWGLTLTAFNGSWNFGSTNWANGNSVIAPIGSNGDEANIPKGCIAFKINEEDVEQEEGQAAPSYNVRVIVSIPISEYYPGQIEGGESMYNLDTGEDYYFGIWHTENAGSSLLESFEKSNAMEKFELPRSHPYEVNADPDTNEYIHVTFGNDPTVYRAYLHGDQILVAYTFTVTEAGVYVLGATNGPMEIVYFSADNTASNGKDGTSSYRLGTIDFVYDNSIDGNAATKVITVRDADQNGDGIYDYSEYYYPSLALFYTDNSNKVTPVLSGDVDTNSGFSNINDFVFYVQRKRYLQESTINWSALGSTQYSNGIADAAYLQFVRYAINADTINRATDALRSIE